MRKMIILAYLNDSHWQSLHQAAPGWAIIDGRSGRPDPQDLAEAEILLGWNQDVAPTCLAAGAHLRWIQTFGAGVDGMPLVELKSRNVFVTNASGVHPLPISETIFGLMLAFARKIGAFVRNQSEHLWRHDPHLSEIHGKTIGILGVGTIGEETARLAQAFQMRVLGLRRSGQASPYVDVMYGADGLDQVLSQSDYVINILPFTAETHHAIGSAAFACMKPNAIYINVGRGETTDTDALIQALRENRIAGAGLDVVAPEPLPPESPLWAMPNVLITPHSAGGTEHYTDRVMAIFLANLQAYLDQGSPAHNVVDLGLGY
jgi:phosphoglycerate dehydrogenase-like enzyme